MNFDGVKAAVELVAEYEMLDSKRRYLKSFDDDFVKITVVEPHGTRSVEFTAEKAIVEAVFQARLHEITNKLYPLGVYPPVESAEADSNE